MMNPNMMGGQGTHGPPLYFNAPYFGMNMDGDGNHPMHHNPNNNANIANHYMPIIGNQPPFSFEMQNMLGMTGMMQHPLAFGMPPLHQHANSLQNIQNFANERSRIASMKKVGKAPSTQAPKGGRKRSGSTVSDTIQRRESNSDEEDGEEPGTKRLTRNQREQKR
jgi:hypothetical protein